MFGTDRGIEYQKPEELSDKVVCYNHEGNEWNDKATFPVNKITIKKTEKLQYCFRGCSLRVFKGVLINLESIDLSS